MLKNILLLEKIRQQKLEMIRICEARIEDLEDRYCKQSNARFGNVFNAWKEI
jgi:hypothetical protein